MRYIIGKTSERRLQEEEFRASLERPLPERLDLGFIKTYKPILDDAHYRIFETMPDYKQWCLKQLPFWLGYGR